MPKLTFLGHAAFLLEGAGSTLIFDPFLSGSPFKTPDIDELKVDYILLTHAHGDHVGDTLEIAKKNNATLISTYEIASYFLGQGLNAHPLHIGGGHDFPFGRVKLTIAHHGSTLETDQGLTTLGPATGMLVTIAGKTLYHAGDTGLFYDMKLIGEMNPIDVALLPIGDNFTMGIPDAVKAAEFLGAKTYIPMHYNTFDLIKVDPAGFVDGVSALGKEAKVLDPGDSCEF